MPNLCYWCGRLTHNDRDCELWIDNENTLTPEQHEFGPNLKAPPFVAARKSVIKVLRFYAVKKKMCSGTPIHREPCRKDGFGKGKASK